MVREKKSSRRHARKRSIWETPRIKQMLAEPTGSPADLTREESKAIAREAAAQDRRPRPAHRARGLPARRNVREIPSRGDVKKCVVDGDAIRGIRRPLLLARAGQVLNLWGEDKGETA